MVQKVPRNIGSSCAHSSRLAFSARPTRPISSISLTEASICARTMSSCSVRLASSRVSSASAACPTAISSRRSSSLSRSTCSFLSKPWLAAIVIYFAPPLYTPAFIASTTRTGARRVELSTHSQSSLHKSCARSKKYGFIITQSQASTDPHETHDTHSSIRPVRKEVCNSHTSSPIHTLRPSAAILAAPHRSSPPLIRPPPPCPPSRQGRTPPLSRCARLAPSSDEALVVPRRMRRDRALTPLVLPPPSPLVPPRTT